MVNKSKKLTPSIKPSFHAAEIERTLRNFYVDLNECFTRVDKYQRSIFVPPFLANLDELYITIAEACEYSSYLDSKRRVELINKAITMGHLIVSKLIVIGKSEIINHEQINRLSMEFKSLNEHLHSFRAYTDKRFAQAKSKLKKDKDEPKPQQTK